MNQDEQLRQRWGRLVLVDHRSLTQTEQRRRRRARLSVVYDDRFDLTAEVREIAAPLAERVAAEPSPVNYLFAVQDLNASVNGAMRTLAGLLTERDAVRKVSHIPHENRRRAIDRLRLLTERPAEPLILDGDLLSGRWVTALADQAAPYSDSLAACLGRALPPGSPDLSALAISISEQVEAALRDIDLAASDLAHRLDRFQSYRAQNPPRLRPNARHSETDLARAELAELGVAL